LFGAQILKAVRSDQQPRLAGAHRMLATLKKNRVREELLLILADIAL
jgi:hypothetical protein